jgi:hypothetical protein
MYWGMKSLQILGHAVFVSRPRTIRRARKLLQPYCNRAGTDAYTVDTTTLTIPQNTCKTPKFTDALLQARTRYFRLLISRFQVRVLDGSLFVKRIFGSDLRISMSVDQ